MNKLAFLKKNSRINLLYNKIKINSKTIIFKNKNKTSMTSINMSELS